MSELNLVKKGEKNSQNLVPIKTLISFGMGSLGNNIICAFIGTYLTVYLTDSFGIGADRKSTRLNSSHIQKSRMPSSA